MSTALIETLLERKFVLALVAQLSSLALVAFAKLDGEQWTQLNMVILGSFTLGNISEHFARKQ
tara:strand:+ start:1199 stop:1387 length:189 start_codon:yes stop_codon:yes gene_type:complete